MLSKWIADLESADRNVRTLALKELEQLGPAAKEAVPALIAALQKAQDEWNLLPGDPAVKKARGDWSIFADFARTLAAIGPDAKAAVPLLVPLIDPNGAFMWDGAAPAFAVLRIGGEPCEERLAVSSLVGVRFLRSTGMEEGEVIAELTRQHPVERIGPYLVEELPKAGYRGGATEALANYGAAAVPLLLPLLRQNSGPEQMRYAFALAAIGAPSVPALREELIGSSVAGRVGAARTLGLLAERAQDAFEDLVAVLDDDAAEVRYHAALALVQINASRASAAIPYLVADLESPDAGIRGEAARLLTRLAEAGQPAESALPALSRLLTDPEVRLDAALAQVAINAGAAVAAVPVLGEALVRTKVLEIPGYDSAGAAAAEEMLKALGRIGRPAAGVAPLLRQLLQSPNEDIATSAALALLKVAPEWTTEAVHRLVSLVSDVNYDHCFWMGIAALTEIGPAARQAVPRLEEWLFDEASRGSSECYCPEEPVPQLFAALVKIDPTASARVLAHIEADLQSPDRFDKAVSLLLDIAQVIPAASAPLLATLLQDKRAEGRWDSIRTALGKLQEASSFISLPQRP